MSLSTNTTYRVFVEKLGSSDPAEFIGDQGELFYDPSSTSLYISDGSTPGGVVVAGGGGGSQWTTTGSGIYYNAGNVAIGTNVVGSGSTTLLVDGNARITGILTIGTSSITLDPSNNTITADFLNTPKPVGAAYTVPNKYWAATYGEKGKDSDKPERWTAVVSFDNDGNVYSHGGSYGYGAPEAEFSFVNKYSSSGGLTWSRQYIYQGPFDNPNYQNVGESMVVNKATNELYFTVGISTSDYANTLIKADPSNGDIIWQKKIDQSYNYSVQLAHDSSGNIYNLCGRSTDDILLIKFDSDGNDIWKKNISNNNSNYPLAISLDSNDNIYLIIEGSDGSFYHSVVMKLDSSANILWQKQIDNYPGVILLGGKVDFEDNLCVYGLNSFVAKLDPDGNIIWQKEQNPSNLDVHQFLSAAFDTNNNIYMTDYSSGYYNNRYLFVCCLDSSGTLLSYKYLHSDENEYSWYWDGHDLIDVRNDELVVGGYTYHYTPNQGLSEALVVKLPTDLTIRDGYIDEYKLYSDNLFELQDTSFSISDVSVFTVGISTVSIISGSITTGNRNNVSSVTDYYKPILSKSDGVSVIDKVRTKELTINKTPIRSTSSNFNCYTSIYVGPNAGTVAYRTGAGQNQIFFGAGAGSKSTGYDNIFMGSNAGTNNQGGSLNNFFGYYAGCSNTNGSYNNFFGAGAGFCNISGSYNNFFGNYAGCSNTSGRHNNFLGSFAGRNNISGCNNNFFGLNAGTYNTTGSNNNFFGRCAGYCNTTGCYNNFIGNSAGQNNTTGFVNTFIGSSAGYGNTSGFYNTFVGRSSGFSNISGCYNSFLGAYAGWLNTTGSHNTFVGTYVACSTSASYKVLLGNAATYGGQFDSPEPNKDRQLAIGIRTDFPQPSDYWIVGNENFNVGIGTTNPTTKLQVGGDVKVGVNTSQGVILTAPNGTSYRVIVNNGGTLTTVAV